MGPCTPLMEKLISPYLILLSFHSKYLPWEDMYFPGSNINLYPLSSAHVRGEAWSNSEESMHLHPPWWNHKGELLGVVIPTSVFSVLIEGVAVVHLSIREHGMN